MIKQWYIFVDKKGGIYIRHIDELNIHFKGRVGQKFAKNSYVAIEIGAVSAIRILVKCCPAQNKVFSAIEGLDVLPDSSDPHHIFELEQTFERVYKKGRRRAQGNRLKKGSRTVCQLPKWLTG